MNRTVTRRKREGGPDPIGFLTSLSPLVELSAKRAVLVANDLRISPTVVDMLGIGGDDLLIQFNQAVLRQYFTTIRCEKAFVFNRHGEGNWGFGGDGALEVDIFSESYSGLFVWLPEGPSPPVAAFMESNSSKFHGLVFYPGEDLVLFPYPRNAKMSAGFAAICVLRLVNFLRTAKNFPPLSIVVVGFTGESVLNGKVVDGRGIHDFAFEQVCIGAWDDLIRCGFDGARIA